MVPEGPSWPHHGERQPAWVPRPEPVYVDTCGLAHIVCHLRWNTA